MGGGKVKDKSVTRDPFGLIDLDIFRHVCAECNLTFDSEQALAAHAFRKHAARSEIDRWIHGVTCWACGVKFWSLARIKQHLSKRAKKNRCIIRIVDFGLTDPISKSSEMREADSLNRVALNKNGQRAHFAQRAAIRICGPVLS
jgi:hypothetical protein